MPHVALWEVSDPSVLNCDLCIIGTGPAGCTIARELSGSGLRIAILESGGFERQKQIDALNEIESIGRPRTIDQWRVRNRIVGGTSHTWTGRCAPYDEIDFTHRNWIPYSGWPFGLDHLTHYLDRSAKYLGLATGSGFSDERFWELAGLTPPEDGPDSRYLLPFFWQSSRDHDSQRDFMRFGRHLLGRLGPDVTLVTDATVLRINSNEPVSAVTSVDVRSLNGVSHRIAASTVVICAGGVENARLLLSSDQQMPQGLGNQNDLVGRFLMDHPRDSVGFFPNVPRRLQKRFGSYKITTPSGHNTFRRGFRLSPRIQEDEELLNCSAFLRDVIALDDPWVAFTNLLNGSRSRKDYTRIAISPRLFARALHNYFISTNPMPHKLQRVELICMCEQVPDPASRITLSTTLDRFGMRISRIDWRTHEKEARTVRRMAQLVAEHLTSIGEQPPTLDEWVRNGDPFPPNTFLEVAHPLGTTRMSDDPRDGVVDRHCQVHGINGLYLAGSSVFPTAGHCNPTQMIVALAIRLSDTLRLRISPRVPDLAITRQKFERYATLPPGPSPVGVPSAV